MSVIFVLCTRTFNNLFQFVTHPHQLTYFQIFNPIMSLLFHFRLPIQIFPEYYIHIFPKPQDFILYVILLAPLISSISANPSGQLFLLHLLALPLEFSPWCNDKCPSTQSGRSQVRVRKSVSPKNGLRFSAITSSRPFNMH